MVDSQDMMDIELGEAVDRYQIRGFIGAGATARVFAALDPRLGRTVALKLIRTSGNFPSRRAQTLLREAKALARVQHPNVVTIHDVGTDADRVFIAMERVPGPTLAEWLAAGARSWRAIRDAFVAAGRGLVAAREAGIGPRHFEPHDVIVGPDRPVVVDFGLAADRDDPDEATTDADDQTAFASAMLAAFSAGAAKENLPERVRIALARAVADRPGDRWPRLADLLDELERDPAATRRRTLAIGALAVAAIAAPLAFMVGRRTPAPSCAMAPSGLWDEATRAAVRSAFLATGKGFAGDSFDRVDTALRARVASWEQAREEACAATEVRHEQAPALMEARMVCLERARGQIAAFTSALRAADALAVERATAAAGSIGDLEACAGPALATVVPLPADAAVAGAVRDVEGELARIGALGLAGRSQDVHEAGPLVVERARATAYEPLLARALYDVGFNDCTLGDPRAGSEALYQSVRTAAAARDDFLVARAYTALVYCVGVKDLKIEAGLTLAEAAEAALARVGSPLELRAQLYREESRLRRVKGDLVNALTFAELGLLTNRRAYGEGSLEVGRSFVDVGNVLVQLGGFRGALALYLQALPIVERWRGPDHPAVATIHTNVGNALVESGDLEAAAVALQRALAVQELAAGPSRSANFLRNLANARQRQGQLDAAWELARRARALDEAGLRPGHPDTGVDLLLLSGIAFDRRDLQASETLANEAGKLFVAAYGEEHDRVADVNYVYGQIARKRGDLDRALALTKKTLDVHRKALGPRHPYVANDESALGAILLARGEAALALPILEADLVIQEGVRDGDAMDTLIARSLLAEALLATGDRPRALALAERSFAGVTTRPTRGDVDGQARFVLARALGPADRARAIALARQARTLFASSPADEEVARVDAWLERNRAR